MVLLMLSDLMQRIQDLFKPYTIDEFMNDAKPVDHKDVQRLEKIWADYQSRKLFNSCY
jgi:hypothetical protein